jgi:hypothetical protein
MNYTEVSVPREFAREELIAYLHENSELLTLPAPTLFTGYVIADRHGWVDRTTKAGLSINNIAQAVYQRLQDNKRAEVRNVTVQDSETMHLYNAYVPLKCKMIIVEEIIDLIRKGVLVQVKFKRQNAMNYDFDFGFDTDFVMLTDYGTSFIQDTSSSPFFTDKYIDLLQTLAPLDKELYNYLREGLACLNNGLNRASAILLRAAIEHTLGLLITSTKEAIKDSSQRSMFDTNIRKARNTIEERAEVVFKKLESTVELVPDSDYFRGMIRNRLRAAFHSIRDLGGRAVHTSNLIEAKEVSDHYTLYSSSVYAIVMQIITYHSSL